MKVVISKDDFINDLCTPYGIGISLEVYRSLPKEFEIEFVCLHPNKKN